MYHPACLVDAFFELRPSWERLRAIEANVLKQLAHVDPRVPIIVNSLRCHGFPHSQARYAFPTLWKEGGNFYRICGEHHAKIPLRRSIYIPYLDTWHRRYNPLDTTRDRVLVFAGSLLSTRRKAIAKAVRNTPGGEVIEYHNRSHTTIDFTRYEFVACPPGDSPESQRIMQAIVHGAIPLVNKAMYRFPFFDWANISRPLHIEKAGAIYLPSQHLRPHIRESLAEANRSFFDMTKWRAYIRQSWRAASSAA